MKLVEIKDIRAKQIWRNSYGDLALIKKINGENIGIHQWNHDISSEQDYNTTLEYITKNSCNWKLIGFLGITHEIKGNKLVEILRITDFQMDDVVKFEWEPRLYVINREIDFDIKKIHPNNHCFEATHGFYGSRQLVDFELKHVGILGVTHEFVNERLVK